MRRNSPLSWSGAEDTGFVLAQEPSVDAFLTTDVAFRAGLVPLDSDDEGSRHRVRAPGTIRAMDDGTAPPLTVVQPGEGRVEDLGDGLGVVFKLWGADTGGSVAVVEHPFEVGAYVSAHLHTREDEYSIVTAGEIGFRSGEREVVLEPGGYITKPRGELHAMWNAGSSPARMIEIISPAGFENFFRDIADMAAAGVTEPAEFAAAAERYGLQFGEPAWQADVIRRYGLTPPAS